MGRRAATGAVQSDGLLPTDDCDYDSGGRSGILRSLPPARPRAQHRQQSRGRDTGADTALPPEPQNWIPLSEWVGCKAVKTADLNTIISY